MIVGTEGVQEVVERYLRDVVNGTRLEEADQVIANVQLRQKATAFRTAFPDLTVTAHLVFSAGPLVAVHLTGRGTHSGVFQGIPASGRQWAAGCTAIYRVRDGRIEDAWENWDLLTILEQVGGIQRAATASA